MSLRDEFAWCLLFARRSARKPESDYDKTRWWFLDPPQNERVESKFWVRYNSTGFVLKDKMGT